MVLREQIQNIEQDKAQDQLDDKHDNGNNPKIPLTVLIINSLIDTREPEPSKEAAQMPEIINIIRSHRSEQDREHNKHQTDTHKLTFQNGPNFIQAWPVDYHVADHDAQDSVETSWGSGFYCCCVADCGEDVSCYCWDYVDYYAADCAETVLESGKQDYCAGEISEKVHEIDM